MKPIRFKKKTDKWEFRKAYLKILITIKSSQTEDHLISSEKMLNNFINLFEVPNNIYVYLLNSLTSRYKALNLL